jgi:saccharopine dehydrogenase-like NADP-dependent oxidoreductase
VFCSVTGQRNGQHVQLTDARKIYHQDIAGIHWSAIQVTTAAGICTMVDLVKRRQLIGTGFLTQESVSLDAFLNNRFGRYYESQLATRYGLSHEQLREHTADDATE